jgi:hypothetical protein
MWQFVWLAQQPNKPRPVGGLAWAESETMQAMMTHLNYWDTRPWEVLGVCLKRIKRSLIKRGGFCASVKIGSTRCFGPITPRSTKEFVSASR